MKALSVFLGETLGTFTLLFLGVGSAVLAGGDLGLLGVALVFGLAVMMMAYVVGPLSGAHMNPAVSLSLLAANKISFMHFLVAAVGQVVGALIGVGAVYMIASSLPSFVLEGGMAANTIAEGFGVYAGLIAEFVATFLLCLVVLTTTTKSFPASIGGIVAGLTLTAGIAVIGPVTNAAINPTRALASAVYDTSALSELWIFFVAPLAGGLFAALVFQMASED